MMSSAVIKPGHWSVGAMLTRAEQNPATGPKDRLRLNPCTNRLLGATEMTDNPSTAEADKLPKGASRLGVTAARLVFHLALR
jgi:hypothetical protein